MIQNYKDIPNHLKKISDFYGFFAIIKIFSPLILSVYFIPITTNIDNSSWLFINCIILGIYAYKITFIMHDCSHGTLFKSKNFNIFFGVISSSFLATNFFTFREHHWRHHSNFGFENDPQLPDYNRNIFSNKFNAIIHIIRPLFGFNLFKLKKFSLSENNFNKKINLLTIINFLLIFFIQLTIAYTMSSKFQNIFNIFIYPVVVLTFSLFLSQLRGVCEHAPIQTIIKIIHLDLINLTFLNIYFYMI